MTYIIIPCLTTKIRVNPYDILFSSIDKGRGHFKLENKVERVMAATNKD